jgi:hypothetical protein
MTIDRYSIARIIQHAKKIEIVTLNPYESDHIRQADIRKLINESTRQSSTRVMMLIAVEIC